MVNNVWDENRFGEETELTAQTMEWGHVGDYILGTFVKARHHIETQFGTNSIYEILAEKGHFHKLTKKVPATDLTMINKGEVWSIWGRSEIFNQQMNSLTPGQMIKIIYTDDVDTKMGTMKMIKVRAPRNNEGQPVMNESYLDSLSVTGEDM